MSQAIETKTFPDWQDDKRWSDQFNPEIKRICGENLIAVAPEEEDCRHNTDLMVLQMKPMRIACRVRRYGYFEKYPYEITLRAKRASGAPTEFSKILAGWGDYLFYGFAAPQGPHLHAWILADLNVFRKWHRECDANQRSLGRLIPNADGRSAFYAFTWKDLPQEFVIAKGIRISAPVLTATESTIGQGGAHEQQ